MTRDMTTGTITTGTETNDNKTNNISNCNSISNSNNSSKSISNSNNSSKSKFISIKILLFGRIKEELGKSEIHVNCDCLEAEISLEEILKKHVNVLLLDDDDDDASTATAMTTENPTAMTTDKGQENTTDKGQENPNPTTLSDLVEGYNCMIALNMNYLSGGDLNSTILSTGDVLAFIPPVSGG